MALRGVNSKPLVIPGQYTSGGLPAASIYPQLLAWVTDLGCFMQSDGASWKSTTPGTPYSFPVGSPNARTIALSTAYQATDPTKPSLITLNLISTASISLLNSTQASQKGAVWIAATAADALAGTGTAVQLGAYENTQGGTLVVTLVLTQTVPQQSQVALPTNWYFAVKQTTGANLTITSAFDQSIG